MYVSADGTGVPMGKEELAERAGKQPDGTAVRFEPKASLSAPGSLKQAAKLSSAPGASSRACFGANRVPKTYWPYAASTAAAGSECSGKTGSTVMLLAMTPSPRPHSQRKLSCALHINVYKFGVAFPFFSHIFVTP